MAFYQLKFIKFKRLSFVGAFIILIIYSFFNDISNLSIQIGKLELPPFPNNPRIERIDVSRGEDFWILTNENKVTYSFLSLWLLN